MDSTEALLRGNGSWSLALRLLVEPLPDPGQMGHELLGAVRDASLLAVVQMSGTEGAHTVVEALLREAVEHVLHGADLQLVQVGHENLLLLDRRHVEELLHFMLFSSLYR